MLSYKKFLVYFVYGVYMGAICFFVPSFGYLYMKSTASHTEGGKDYDLYTWFLCSFLILVFSHLIQLWVSMMSINLIDFAANFLNLIFLFPICLVINNYAEDTKQYQATWEAIGSPVFWLCLLLGLGFILMPFFAYKDY